MSDSPQIRQLIVRVTGFGADLARDQLTINAHLNGVVTCATCNALDLAKAESWAELLRSAPRFGLGVELGVGDDADTVIKHFRMIIEREPDHVLGAGGTLILPHLADSQTRQTASFAAPYVVLGDLLLVLSLLSPGLTELVCSPPPSPDAPDWAALSHKAAREMVAAEGIQLIAYRDVSG